LTLWTASIVAEESMPPAVGEKAPDFALKSIDGTTISRTSSLKSGPMVLVVLRGYPGYQCPICNMQVGDLLKRSKEFQNAKATVVLVYPGPSSMLLERAKEFIGTRTIPENFHLVMDPDYRFTDAYHLRWDAPGETAYPSTFVVGKDNIVRYALVSKTHGGRAKAKDLLKALSEIDE
jgi:peroxiredoxin